MLKLSTFLTLATVVSVAGLSLPSLAGEEARPDQCDTLPADIRQYSLENSISVFDAAREWVNRTSIHAQGDAFVTSSDPFAIVAILCGVSKGEATPPHLLCGHRAQALQAVLARMGFATRMVYLYSEWDGPDTIYGHAFIEVLDPATGRWQVQDPDYNVAYENERGRRLSIAQIVAHPDRSQIMPVNAVQSGWAETGVMPLLRGNYYAIAFVPAAGMLYFDREAGERGTVARVGELILSSTENVQMNAARVGP